MMPTPRAWIEVDLRSVRHNVRYIRSVVGRDIGIMAVVKSNAYGHGLVPVAKALIGTGVSCLGVTQPQEGLELRDAGVTLPILVMGPTDPWEIAESVRRRLTLTAYSETFARRVAVAARSLGVPAAIHVKVDTGMGRMGVWCADAPELVGRLTTIRPLLVEGIYTHFPDAEGDPAFTQEQIRLFQRVIDRVAERGIDIRWRHAANSAALFRYPKARFNLVRPGLALYGLRAGASQAAAARLEPALSLKARVTDVRLVPAGRSISYGRTYVTQRPTRIATLPIGYADGYSRALSNRAAILVNGRRASVAGRVCMDFTMVDVGRVGPVRPGDEVVLLGRCGDQRVGAEELARLEGTIPYEVVCGLSARLARIYRGRAILVAPRSLKQSSALATVGSSGAPYAMLGELDRT